MRFVIAFYLNKRIWMYECIHWQSFHYWSVSQALCIDGSRPTTQSFPDVASCVWNEDDGASCWQGHPLTLKARPFNDKAAAAWIILAMDLQAISIGSHSMGPSNKGTIFKLDNVGLSMGIDVNPGIGCVTTSRFWDGVLGRSYGLQEILSHLNKL